jgi:hypothetical protein
MITDLAWMQTIPTWVVPLVSALLGSAVGGLATYCASYALERRKWRATAAVLRKDQVYSPVYDDLAKLVDQLGSEDAWRRVPEYNALGTWRALSHSSRAVGLPRTLKLRLDCFVRLCDEYVSAQRWLFCQIREAFPEEHLQQEDCGVVYLVAGRAVLGMVHRDHEVVEYLRQQGGPSRPDLSQYWTRERFDRARMKLETLPAWGSVTRCHDNYVQELRSLHDELGERIERIITRYQRPECEL